MGKKRDKAEKTRAKILAAAADVLACRGFNLSSLEEIAQRAGVTRGAVHWHFENKASMLAALLDDVLLPLESLRAGSNFDDDCDRLAEAVMETVRNPIFGPIAKILVWHPHPTPDQACIARKVDNIRRSLADYADPTVASTNDGDGEESVDSRLLYMSVQVLIAELLDGSLEKKDVHPLLRIFLFISRNRPTGELGNHKLHGRSTSNRRTAAPAQALL